jgi:hypothetical protein
VRPPSGEPLRFWWCVGRGFAWGLGVCLAAMLLGWVLVWYVAIAIGQQNSGSGL